MTYDDFSKGSKNHSSHNNKILFYSICFRGNAMFKYTFCVKGDLSELDMRVCVSLLPVLEGAL